MKINAAMLWEQGKPLSVEEAELEAPRAGEVLVEVKAAGVCQSDLHPARGDWPARLPLVLGHEGAGIVREVGAGVTRVRAGDHVVFCWVPSCGVCPPCLEGRPVLCDRLLKTTYRNRLPAGGTRLRARGQDVGHFNGTAGCAVVTGIGAVTNAARVERGARVAVIGAGGVGLNVVQGAVLAGCEKIIAVDTRPRPLNLARDFGATHTIEAGAGNVAEEVRALTD